MEEEVWKSIRDYEGLYEVSNLGRVKSLNYRKTGKKKILKNVENNKGYLTVYLTKNGKRKLFQVHRLVAETFIPNPEDKPCVDHINTIRDDNRVENLRWVTYEENNNNPLTKKKYSKNHREQTGEKNPMFGRTGEKNPMYGKYCKGIYCIELNISFNSIKEASKELNISSQSICNALNGFSKSAGRHPITNEKLHWKYV